MKKLLILMFIGVVVLMGYYDGGDITAGLVLLLIFAPSIFERKKKEADKAATLTTSRGLSGDKTYIYYSGKGGVCQLPQSAKLTAPSEREPLVGGARL